MIAGWKEFAFFDCTPVTDPHTESKTFGDAEAVEFSPSTRGTLFILNSDGRLQEIDSNFELLHEFRICAHTQTPDAVRAVPNTHYVLTVCSSTGHALELTVWDAEKETLHARCMIQNGTNTFPLTCLDMLDDLSVIVLGFADGNVVSVRGDLLHDKGTRQRQVHAAQTSITHLALNNSGECAFVCAVNSVQVVSTNSAKLLVNLERTKGAALNCACKVANGEQDPQLLVARESDLVFYNTAHRGASFELPVPKRLVHLSLNNRYLVLTTILQVQTSTLLPSSPETLRVVVVDLRNHLVAFNAYLSSGIKAVFDAWGCINIIGANGTMYMLKEKTLDARIAALKQQNLYQVAIKMASKEEGSTNHVLYLHQDYADYLFNKRDIEGSLKEYINAIPLNRTSKAINRFKDSHHAAALLEYLNALYLKGFATPQHINLQIVCMAKLYKVEDLAKFLPEAVKIEGFDFEQAIDVLMETHDKQYARLAAFLAEEIPDPDLAVQIRLRQLHDVRGTLEYIQTVRAPEAVRVLIQNARALLDRLPLETTGLLITLFTCKFKQRTDNVKLSLLTSLSSTNSNNDDDAGKFNQINSYKEYLEVLGSGIYAGNSIVSANALINDDSDPAEYLPPKPRLIFPSFINHNNEFVVFLEACLEAAPKFHPPEKDVRDIASTLYETYLSINATDRASKLVETHAKFLDSTQTQIASQISSFRLDCSRQVALGQSHASVLRQSVEAEKYEEALEFLLSTLESKNLDPSLLLDLCHQGVKLFTSDGALEFLLAKNEFLNLLHKCMENGMTAAEILSELSSSNQLQIKDVKPFILELLSTISASQQKHTKLAESYKSELSRNEQAITKQEGSLVFRTSLCTACTAPLEPPLVHYACQHSYHKACTHPSSKECPKCLPEIDALELLKQQQEEESVKEDLFYETLNTRADKMKVINDFISKGALSRPV